MRLVLASSSPRRKELLERIGLAIEVHPANVDETPTRDEEPLAYVARLATAKAEAVRAEITRDGSDPWVLGADTIVEVDGAILGKAKDANQALGMLRFLAGREHRVCTAFSLRGPDGGACDRVVTTSVALRPATDIELIEYVRAGEWQGKAGA